MKFVDDDGDDNKVAHPGHSDFIQPILECINAAGWNSLPIQGIPAINYMMFTSEYMDLCDPVKLS